jgi:valyl-tRNA synthetase
MSRCYRCKEVLEPYLSDQWFVRMKPLVAPAIGAVERGDVRFHPDRHRKTFLEWLQGIKDWCISRQLWWGHRIPVWYCPKGHLTASLEAPRACGACGDAELKQDEDVLDTWFSSALWPFATLGWPDETPDLEAFYPTSVLITARDILNLWVARMIFMGYEFCGDKPFSDVIVHATIQTIEGKRMSKSLGTGVDPLELIGEYGADALRFLLARKSTGSQDVRLGLPHELLKKKGIPVQGIKEDRSILEARNFVTKIWNACRFVLQGVTKDRRPPGLELGPVDKWILSRLSTTTSAVTAQLEAYEFGRAAETLYGFVWDEFCDYYIEMAKPKMQVPDVQAVLLRCVKTILKLSHPTMPFVTEAIWKRLHASGLVTEPILARAEWPEASPEDEDPALEKEMRGQIEVLTGIRKFRRDFNLSPKEPLLVSVKADPAEFSDEPVVARVLGNARVQVCPDLKRPKGSWSYVAGRFSIFIPLEGKIDVRKEIARQEKALADLRGRIEAGEKKLSNPGFRKNADPEVVEEEEERLAGLRASADEVERLLRDLKS